VKTLFRPGPARRSGRRSAGTDRVWLDRTWLDRTGLDRMWLDRGTTAGKPGMRAFGIEQFELEEFKDSGFGQVEPGGGGTSLQVSAPSDALALRGPLAARNPDLVEDHASLRRRPGRRQRRSYRRIGEKLRTRGMLLGSESGMATAEYAIATLAAVGLAGLLVVILRSEEVRGFLLNLIRTALSLP